MAVQPPLRVAFFEVEPWEQAYLLQVAKKRFDGLFECSFRSEALSIENAPKNAANDGVDVLAVFVYSRLTADVLKCFPNLKLVLTMSTGFDHIDLKECKARGIPVCNVPSYGENTVAEHTFALLLNLSRKVHQAYERTVRGHFSLEGLRGWDLKGKTIGVVGTGKIGRHVIRIANGFEMNVLAFDPYPDAALTTELAFRYVSFDELLAHSDVVTLHAPLTPDTAHLINAANIRKMKKGAVLINTARGGLVETNALVDALADGWLSGAGLDVFEDEELFKEEKQVLRRDNLTPERQKMLLEEVFLLQRQNVIITPHNAFNSLEALQRILDTTLDNLGAFAGGQTRNNIA